MCKIVLLVFATALVVPGLVSALPMDEHWVCAMPHKLDASQSVIFDFQVKGQRLVMKLPAEAEFSLVRNDDRAITAIRVVPILPDKVAEVVSIDKQRGIFKLMQVFFGMDTDVPSAGGCKKIE